MKEARSVPARRTTADATASQAAAGGSTPRDARLTLGLSPGRETRKEDRDTMARAGTHAMLPPAAGSSSRAASLQGRHI